VGTIALNIEFLMDIDLYRSDVTDGSCKERLIEFFENRAFFIDFIRFSFTEIEVH
jgi:hypothetical protein